MSDYELIMLILEVMTVVIAFGGYRTKSVANSVPKIGK